MRPVPQAVAEAARQRLLHTFSEQKETLQKIRQKKPMEAEEDNTRKVSYVQRKLDVNRGLADKIAHYGDVAVLPMSAEKQSKAEAIQGPTVDFMGICFVDLARAASRAVARVIFPNGEPEGSGFLVSPRLFLTNNHVIPSKESAKSFLLEFNYELDYDSKETEKTRYRLDPDALFLTDDRDDLDFTLVAIGDRVDGSLALEDIGFLPLFDDEDKHMKGTLINCIQHPNGTFKNIVVRDSRLLARTPNTLIYSSDTLPGSSGSPVFNDDFEVIALHHWGGPYRAMLDPGDTSEDLPLNGNEGIRISSIIRHLTGLQNLPAKEKSLLNPVLKPGFRQPSLMHSRKPEPGEEGTEKRDPKPTHMPETNVTIPVNGQAATFTIPLTITVQVGTPAQGEGLAEKAGVTTILRGNGNTGAEGLRPDTDWHTRRGYNPNFLGVKLSLPRLSARQKKEAARNLKAAQGDNPLEFKYHHFSVVMNGKRRLPFFTAVNIDGASVVKINRDTGVVTRGPEAAEGREKWYDDDRIDPEQVCEDGLYDDDPGMRIFHRGHLVKRTDPSWGTESAALKGQADTFFFTNCSPQHHKFNPNKSRWAGLEDWITNTSDNADLRVTVFSGPVFDKKDQKVDYLPIPEQFWKVVAWMEDGELMATGVLASQKDLLDASWGRGSEERLTAGELPDGLQEYKCSIAYLEELTDLDFGMLAQHDTFETGGAEALGAADLVPIKEYEEILPSRKRKKELFG